MWVGRKLELGTKVNMMFAGIIFHGNGTSLRFLRSLIEYGIIRIFLIKINWVIKI